MLRKRWNGRIDICLLMTISLVFSVTSIYLHAMVSLESNQRNIENKPNSLLPFKNDATSNELNRMWQCTGDPKVSNKHDGISHFSGIDFYLAGWPKTGTSTLLHALSRHPEIAMPSEESWWWWRTGNEKMLSKIEIQLSRQTKMKEKGLNNTKVLRGIKCPGEFQGWPGLKFLISRGFSDTTKVIIGIRHPVHLFESFYNFRVQDWNKRGGWFYHHGSVPDPETLFGNVKWGDVNANYLRFDQYLSLLLMNIPPSSSEWKGFEKEAPIFGECFRGTIFVYHIDQIGDVDTNRTTHFKEGIRTFLGLKSTLPPFTKVNSLKSTHPQTINICDSKYNTIRQRLILIGKESYEWILNRFLLSTSVTVSNPDHFKLLLELFQHDPCEQAVLS